MAYHVPTLLAMTQQKLDDLFKGSSPGDIPNGEAKGTAIIAPGTKYSESIAEVINHFGWQGKVFDAKKGLLKNRLLAFGIEAIVAKVYKGVVSNNSAEACDRLVAWLPCHLCSRFC